MSAENTDAHVHVRVPGALLKSAQEAAAREGMTFSELTRFLLREFVRGHAAVKSPADWSSLAVPDLSREPKGLDAPVMQVDHIGKDNVNEVIAVLRRGGRVIEHVSDNKVPPEGVEWQKEIYREIAEKAKAADAMKQLDFIADEYGESHQDGFDALVMRRVIAELTRKDWTLEMLTNVAVALRWAGVSAELRHANGCTARLQFVTAGCEADLWPSTLEVAGRVVIDHGVSWEIAANEAETDARQALARWLVDARC